jgi:hypothetical protein
MSGMDLNRTPYEIARAAAEEIRTLNHRTLPGNRIVPVGHEHELEDPFPDPVAVYDTITAMTKLVLLLPQALDQTAAGLAAIPAKNILMPQGAQSDEAPYRQDAVVSELGMAAACLGVVQAHLAAAVRLTSDLAYTEADTSEDELGTEPAEV